MKCKDLSDFFLGSFQQGRFAPKIEGVDRILVIYEDTYYFAYESNDNTMDEYIVNLFIEVSERETGVSGRLSACFNPDKIFYGFDTEAEISQVELISNVI